MYKGEKLSSNHVSSMRVEHFHRGSEESCLLLPIPTIKLRCSCYCVKLIAQTTSSLQIADDKHIIVGGRET